MGSRSSSSSSSRLAAIGVVTLAVLALNAPTGASAFSSVFGKNANAGDGATEDPGLAGEPAVVTEAVTEEIHSEDPAEKLREFVSRYEPPYDMEEEHYAGLRASFDAVAKAHLATEVVPTTILTDRDGNVFSVRPGVPTVSDIVRLLDR